MAGDRRQRFRSSAGEGRLDWCSATLGGGVVTALRCGVLGRAIEGCDGDRSVGRMDAWSEGGVVTGLAAVSRRGMPERGWPRSAAARARSMARRRRGECLALPRNSRGDGSAVPASGRKEGGEAPPRQCERGVRSAATARRARRSGAARVGAGESVAAPSGAGGVAGSAATAMGSGATRGTGTATATARGGKRTASRTSRETEDPTAALPLAAWDTAVEVSRELQIAMERMQTSPAARIPSILQASGEQPSSSPASTASTANCAS